MTNRSWEPNVTPVRIVEYLNKLQSAKRKYPDNDVYLDDYSLTLESYSTSSVGYFLFYHNAKYNEFSDLDFLKLNHISLFSFIFLDREIVNEVCDILPACDVGRFFVILNEKSLDMAPPPLHINKTDGETDYEKWIKGKSYEQSFFNIFKELLNAAERFPDTPLDLLAELL